MPDGSSTTPYWLGLGSESFIVEVASNDGYLLQHSVARGIRSLGIEPAANIAEVARGRGHRHRESCSSASRPVVMWPPDTARPTWSSPTMYLHTFPTSSISARGCVRWLPTPVGSASRFRTYSG